jgi:hypothetical protein
MIGVGLFALLIGGGLTLWSYMNRDAVTGEFSVWWKSLLIGVVFTVFGFVWRAQENEPLI